MSEKNLIVIDATGKSHQRAGRPSDYDPDYCEQLVEHMGQGFSFESFAGKIGVHRSTLYNWADTYDEFQEAKEEGEMRSRYFWEGMGILGMSGRLPHFNSTTWIFNMKNRHSWKDKVDVTTDDQKIESVSIEYVAPPEVDSGTEDSIPTNQETA